MGGGARVRFLYFSIQPPIRHAGAVCFIITGCDFLESSACKELIRSSGGEVRDVFVQLFDAAKGREEG